MAQKIKILDEINEMVKKLIPSSAGITKIEMEGPEVVIYTKSPQAFFGAENYVSKIAFELKKRVNIRTDKSLLSNPEAAKKKILELVPKEAEIKDIYFEEPFCEVVIEAVKKGIVIGKGGELSKRIIMETGWTPRILRSPTSKSDTLSGIRKHMYKHADERKKFLLKTAEEIYGEKTKSMHQWIRLTALGGFREVGRSCMLLETETTKVLLDAGLNHSSDDPYPYIDALGYPLSEIDAIVISHAHSDHTGVLPFIFKMGFDGPVYCSVDYSEPVMIREKGVIKVVKMGEVCDSLIDESEDIQKEPYYNFVKASPKRNIEVPAFSFKDYKIDFKPVKSVIRHSVADDLFEIKTKTGRTVKVTGSHSVFVMRSGEITDVKVKDLHIGDYLVAPQILPTAAVGEADLSEIIVQVPRIIVKDGKLAINQGKEIPLKVKTSKELMRILGYFAAEGHFEKRSLRFTFGFGEDELTQDLARCIGMVFGLNASQTVPRKDIIRVTVNSLVLKSVFSKIFFKGYAGKATTKHVPELVFNVSNELKKEFLDAYMKGDGHINLLNKTVQATSVSKRLISDLAFLCSQLGVAYSLFSRKIASAKTKNTVYSLTINLSEFYDTGRLDRRACEVIPLKETDFGKEWTYSKFKERKHVTKMRLKELLEKNKVLVMNGATALISEKLLRLANSDLSFLPITEISKVAPTKGTVYDFSVDIDQNFVGGQAPICLHNTEPTRDLMTLLQFDYLDVSVAQEKVAPYAEADVKNALLHTITRDYREVTDIAPDMRLTLHNAAHILGSSSVHINIGEGMHNLVYSADIKFGATRLFDNIDIRYPRMETLIIESTYGSKDAIQMSRTDAEQKLIEIIQETTQFGGNVLIPVFGVGRGQEICMVIEDAYKRGLLSEKNNIYIDGMVREASAIHTAYPEYLRQSLEKRILTNDSPFDSPIFKEIKKEDREKICNGSGAVIVSTSGMMNGGPVIDYFHRLAENSANTLVFVGYLAEGTFGRKIQQGLKTLPISDNGKTRRLEVKMRIETIDGFSGHADFNQLVSYVASLKPKPKKILVDHGDPTRSVEFSKYCAAKFGISSSAIRNLETVRFK